MKCFCMFIFLLGIASVPLKAQRSIVRDDKIQLVFEQEGWRIQLTDPKEKQFGGLFNNDVIRVIGGMPSSRVGPPAVLSTLASPDPRSIALVVRRNGRLVGVKFWSGTGPAPRPKQISTTVSKSFKAPNFSLRSPGGPPVSLSRDRHLWTVLNFWGTWCAPCIAELPEMESIARRQDPKINVIGLAVLDDNRDIESFLRKHPLPYPVARAGDKSSPLVQQYGLDVPGGRLGVPVTVILRPGGEIAYIKAGATENHLASIIEKLMHDDNRGALVK